MEAPFENREVSMFFQTVEEGDNCTTIKEVDRRKLAIPSPNPSSRTDPLEPETESANSRGEVGVRGANTVPVCLHQVSKGGVSEPRVFHTENFAPGGPGGSSKVKRDMIKSGASGGGEGGVGQRKAPVLVDKDPFQASQDGWVLLIGPSELVVEERDLDEPEVVNKPVEQACLRRIKIAEGFVARGPDKVEISKDSNRPRSQGKILVKRVEEVLFEIMVTGAINIYDGEGEVICPPGEGGGDREVVNGVSNKPKMSVVPGSEDAPRSSDSTHAIHLSNTNKLIHFQNLL
jgi:hypothetical protein